MRKADEFCCDWRFSELKHQTHESRQFLSSAEMFQKSCVQQCRLYGSNDMCPYYLPLCLFNGVFNHLSAVGKLGNGEL